MDWIWQVNPSIRTQIEGLWSRIQFNPGQYIQMDKCCSESLLLQVLCICDYLGGWWYDNQKSPRKYHQGTWCESCFTRNQGTVLKVKILTERIYMSILCGNFIRGINMRISITSTFSIGLYCKYNNSGRRFI